MSLRNEILNDLLTKHPEACNLLVNLLQAIDLEKKELSCHDQVKSFDLSELDEWTSATIDNLSLSDASDVADVIDEAARHFGSYDSCNYKFIVDALCEAVTEHFAKKQEIPR
jgi:hypothetical protein